jgi:uncharacterized membrane protein
VESRAKLLGHPIHPMLVVFPLGLLGMAVVFDGVYLWSANGMWADRSYWMIAAGIVTGLFAAVFGWIDWFAIPRGTRAKSIGLAHGLGNVVVVGLFALSWYLRIGSPMSPPAGALWSSLGGLLLALMTGWLGGELVDRLGVGVDDGANLNAPSSLSGRPANFTEPSPAAKL